MIGAILTPVFLLLTQAKQGNQTLKGWKDYDRIDIIVLLLSIAAVAALGASFVSVKPGLPAVAGALSLCCFGLVLAVPIETAAQGGDVSIGIGCYLALLSSLASAIGALAAAALPPQGELGAAIGAGRGASALNRQPAPPTGQPQVVQSSGGAAPGWYPDPNGVARLRYFDGVAWTDQTSN